MKVEDLNEYVLREKAAELLAGKMTPAEAASIQNTIRNAIMFNQLPHSVAEMATNFSLAATSFLNFEEEQRKAKPQDDTSPTNFEMFSDTHLEQMKFDHLGGSKPIPEREFENLRREHRKRLGQQRSDAQAEALANDQFIGNAQPKAVEIEQTFAEKRQKMEAEAKARFEENNKSGIQKQREAFDASLDALTPDQHSPKSYMDKARQSAQDQANKNG